MISKNIALAILQTVPKTLCMTPTWSVAGPMANVTLLSTAMATGTLLDKELVV